MVVLLEQPKQTKTLPHHNFFPRPPLFLPLGVALCNVTEGAWLSQAESAIVLSPLDHNVPKVYQVIHSCPGFLNLEPQNI